MEDGIGNLRHLMNVGRQLVTELDPDSVLERLLEEARAVTGARYAALGVLNEQRTELERLLHLGIDDATVRAINELPRGHGVLGVLIEHPEPLRLDEVGDHDQSFGFPAGHPPMHRFLGVPILIRGKAWGNLYLAEKANGEPFSQADEDAVTILADWAATAVENARRYETSEQRRTELERAVRGLDAARTIADAIGVEPELDRILELVAKRGRALVASRALLIFLRRGDELIVESCAGDVEQAIGRTLSLGNSTAGDVLSDGRCVRIAVDQLRGGSSLKVGVRGAVNAMFVPMIHRGEGLGVLVAFDRGPECGPFTDSDEALLRTFAASAAAAVAMSHSVEADRLRAAIAAAEAERRRWARELHDETLQSLGGLRILLAGAMRRDDASNTRDTVVQAISEIEREIDNLRSIITELRPMLLDDLGLGPAIEALIERRRTGGLEITATLSLGSGDGPPALGPERETTIYRLIQESLTNVVKHARASRVAVGVEISHREAVITITDDGVGFDTSKSVAGFGLAGIRERVYLASGTLEIASVPGRGTTTRAVLPFSGGELFADEAVAEGRLAHGLG